MGVGSPLKDSTLRSLPALGLCASPVLGQPTLRHLVIPERESYVICKLTPEKNVTQEQLSQDFL